MPTKSLKPSKLSYQTMKTSANLMSTPWAAAMEAICLLSLAVDILSTSKAQLS
jgi:hypothetical protein